MALNFPLNPSDGDTYDRFKYNATKGAWDLNTDPIYPITISEVRPVSPKHKDLWIDSASGSLFVYYEDVDTGQWIQVGTSGSSILKENPEYGLSGGLTDYVLTKNSSTDYDYSFKEINFDSDYLRIDSVIKLNPQTISADYTVPVGYNGMSAGPITINDGVIVTVPSGSSWSIV